MSMQVEYLKMNNNELILKMNTIISKSTFAAVNFKVKKKKMKKQTVKLIYCLLVGLFTLAGCKNNPPVASEAVYATLRVSKTDRELTDSYPASIRGRQDIDIYPQVSGFIPS